MYSVQELKDELRRREEQVVPTYCFYPIAKFPANTNPHDDGEAEAKACMSCTEYNASSSAASQIFGVLTTL